MGLLDFLPKTKRTTPVSRGASGTWASGATRRFVPMAPLPASVRPSDGYVERNPMIDPTDWLAGGLAALPKVGLRAAAGSIPLDAIGSFAADRVMPWVEDVPVLSVIAPIAASVATGYGVRGAMDDIARAGGPLRAARNSRLAEQRGSFVAGDGGPALSAGPGRRYYRYTRNPDTPDNGIGFTMWAGEHDKLIGPYGDHGWEMEGADLPHISDIAESVRDSYLKALGNYNLTASLEDMGESLLDEINPEGIVDSAGAWDVPEFVQWFFENIADPQEIKGVRTNDGAILFDQARAKRYSPD